MQPLTISDAPLRIRPITGGDVEAIYRGCQDPEVQKWTTAIPVPYRREDAEEFVTSIAPGGWADNTALTWAIEDPRDDTFLGVISLTAVNSREARSLHPVSSGATGNAGSYEVGYWLARTARGRGVAARALADVCRFGLTGLGLASIHWRAMVGNEPSRRVAEQVGFQVVGPIRRLLFQRGEWRDGWVATLLAEDLLVAGGPVADRQSLGGVRTPVVLTDGTVTLRPWRGSDLVTLPALIDDAVLAWTGFPGRFEGQLRDWLDVNRRFVTPPSGRFAITDESGAPVGHLRLSEDRPSGAVSLGWWLGPAARGKGIAGRAVRLGMRWAVSEGAERLTAGIFVGNAASLALAERLGMRAEGLRRGYWPAREPAAPRRDTWLYGLVPSDPGWPTRR